MRHITWAVTWMLVGLAVTLATASVIQQKALMLASQNQAPMVVPDTNAAADKVRPKSNEPARSLVVASRHRHEAID